MSQSHVKELVEKLKTVENEMKLLLEDRKELFADYKDKVDVKAFKAAWAILKRRQNVNEIELDNILDIVNNIE